MGASRKLQGEIDRVLKKVQEGVDVFDSIWNKVYDTDNVNQKEKFEADLKKEIKKLQRYRDQIKTWIQSSEIKDKKISASYEQALVNSRKLIEKEMERFKICEKETKTKAFSKEGLGQQPKTDPREKAKSETRDWLNNVVGELESQIDSFEAEIESLSVKKGKTRPPRLTHLEASIVKHKAHIMKLELILRLLDNDELSPEQVNDVKDFLDDYVERNQENFDEFSDVDELYSSLPLDKVETLEELVNIGPPSIAKVAPLHPTKSSLGTAPASPLPVEVDSSGLLDVASDSVSQPSGTPSSVSPTGPLSPVVNIPAAISIPTPSQSPASIPSPLPVPPRAPSDSSVGSVSAPPSPAPTPNPAKEEDAPSLRRPLESGVGRGVGRSGLPVASVNSPLPPIPVPSDSSKRTTVGVDERLSSGTVQPLASPVPNRVPLPLAGKVADTSVGTDATTTSDAGGIGARVFSPSLVSNMQWRPGSTFPNPNESGQIRARTEIPPDHREKFLQRYQQVQQGTNILGNAKPFSSPQNPLLSQFNPQTSPITSQPVSTTPSQPPVPQSVSKDSESSQLKPEEPQSVQEESALDSLPKDDEIKSSYSTDTTVGSLSEPDVSLGQLIQPNQASNLGVIGRRSAPDLGAIGESITGPVVSPGPMHDQHYHLQMLEAGYHKLPQPRDSDRPRTYTPKRPASTPASYPQGQAPIVNNPAFWERQTHENFATDTLFFSFYYQQSTYQQYLAAKELKKQSWRYHRKYNTWFQRHEEPKVATEEFEQGTYVYFDFHVGDDDIQHGWCQRIKTDFTFEYNYLEDELLA